MECDSPTYSTRCGLSNPAYWGWGVTTPPTGGRVSQPHLLGVRCGSSTYPSCTSLPVPKRSRRESHATQDEQPSSHLGGRERGGPYRGSLKEVQYTHYARHRQMDRGSTSISQYIRPCTRTPTTMPRTLRSALFLSTTHSIQSHPHPPHGLIPGMQGNRQYMVATT